MNVELTELEAKLILTAIENQPVKGAQLAEVVLSITKKLTPQEQPKV